MNDHGKHGANSTRDDAASSLRPQGTNFLDVRRRLQEAEKKSSGRNRERDEGQDGLDDALDDRNERKHQHDGDHRNSERSLVERELVEKVHGERLAQI